MVKKDKGKKAKAKEKQINDDPAVNLALENNSTGTETRPAAILGAEKSRCVDNSVYNKELRRFQARISDPTKRWKLSPMDLELRAHWVEYSKAKDEMFSVTDIKQAPWYVVNADNNQCARLNCIHHLLGMIPYEDLSPEPIVLPPRQKEKGYVRPPLTDQTFVPEVYLSSGEDEEE